MNLIPVIPVAALADGDMTRCRVDGVDLLLCRVDGRYFALDDHCSHAGQPLHRGRLHGHRLTCPRHGASFDVRDGRCLQAPAERGLMTYPVTIERGRVLVAVDRPRRPAD